MTPENEIDLSVCAFCAFSWLTFALTPAVITSQRPRGFAQFFRLGVAEIDAIDNADNCSFDRHVLISDCRTCGLSKSAHHRLAGSSTQTICDHHDVCRWLFIQIVRMHDQKTHALEVGSFLCGPHCADDFA